MVQRCQPWILNLIDQILSFDDNFLLCLDVFKATWSCSIRVHIALCQARDLIGEGGDVDGRCHCVGIFVVARKWAIVVFRIKIELEKPDSVSIEEYKSSQISWRCRYYQDAMSLKTEVSKDNLWDVDVEEHLHPNGFEDIVLPKHYIGTFY